MLSTVNTKLGTRILYSSCPACIDPEVRSSRSHGYTNCYSAQLLVTIADIPHFCAVLPAAVAVIGVHVDTTAYVF